MARKKKTVFDDGGANRTALKGVRRTLEILEYLAVQPARATDVEAALGLSWATVHRTLDQLEQGGFVIRHSDTNRYSIGPRLWFVGTSYLATHPVLDVAQPYLEVAVPGLDFTVQLVERSGRLAVVLYSHHASGKVITKAAYGYHFPLHAGSKGQALLAYAKPDDVARYLAGPLERLTAETVTEPAQLRTNTRSHPRPGFRSHRGRRPAVHRLAGGPGVRSPQPRHRVDLLHLSALAVARARERREAPRSAADGRQRCLDGARLAPTGQAPGRGEARRRRDLAKVAGRARTAAEASWRATRSRSVWRCRAA